MYIRSISMIILGWIRLFACIRVFAWRAQPNENGWCLTMNRKLPRLRLLNKHRMFSHCHCCKLCIIRSLLEIALESVLTTAAPSPLGPQRICHCKTDRERPGQLSWDWGLCGKLALDRTSRCCCCCCEHNRPPDSSKAGQIKAVPKRTVRC